MNTKNRIPMARFKTLKSAREAQLSGDYSKSEKPHKKGWRNARYEVALINMPS